MRRILQVVFVLWLCGQGLLARADSYSLADGTAVTGDIVTFDDFGVKFRTADGNYTDRVPWAKFSQDSLKQLANNPKIQPLVEPFIEIPVSERAQKPEPKVKDVTRLERPAPQSLFSALLSSPVGLFAVFLIYAANIFAGFEVAVFRARPKALVMGLAAVLPLVGPVVFLALPTQMVATEPELPATEGAEPETFAVPGQPVVETPGLHLVAESAEAKSARPSAQIFQRGQFTFNRRFFETKFAGYFGVVRHGTDKDQTLLVKTGGGQFVVERITRISASDVHLEVLQNGAPHEVMLPFAQIQEIQLQPKTA